MWRQRRQNKRRTQTHEGQNQSTMDTSSQNSISTQSVPYMRSKTGRVNKFRQRRPQAHQSWSRNTSRPDNQNMLLILPRHTDLSSTPSRRSTQSRRTDCQQDTWRRSRNQSWVRVCQKRRPTIDKKKTFSMAIKKK
jgi:hypothetical protein